MGKELPAATVHPAVSLTAPPHKSRPFSVGATGLETETDDGGNISEKLPMGPLVSNNLRKLAFIFKFIQDPDLGPNYLFIIFIKLFICE